MSVSKSLLKNGKFMSVTFYIQKQAAQGAQQIDLICEHNGWEPVVMKPMRDGSFVGSIKVPTSTQPSFQYRFKYTFADGNVQFDNDWDAEAYCPNPYAGDNSVFMVQSK